MLGRDAHIISNMSLNLFAISYVKSISMCLPNYIKERVHVWNHEPRSIFNHKKHFSNHFQTSFIFSYFKIRKYKNTFIHCIDI